MRYEPQADINELMKLYDQEVRHSPALPDKDTLLLRARLVFEEALEFVEACGCGIDLVNDPPSPRAKDGLLVVLDADAQPDLVEYADACGDQLVVTYGALSAAGIDAKPLWAEIQRSNMSKVWPDGTIHKREDGKVLKPPTYSPADVAGVLKRMDPGYTVRLVCELYPEARESVLKGFNLWSWMATEAFGVAYRFTYNVVEHAKEVGAIGEYGRILATRNAAKIITFHHSHKLGPILLARRLETSTAVAEELMDLFEARFPKLMPIRPDREEIAAGQAA